MEYRSMYTYFYKTVNSRALVIVASTLIQCFKGRGILERNIFFSLFILIFKKDEQRERERESQEFKFESKLERILVCYAI